MIPPTVKRSLTVPTESDVAAACDALAVACGWTVERYEQRRATKICEGLPDRRYVRFLALRTETREAQRVWVELKRPGGKLTCEQHRWLESENAAGGMACVVDDVAQLADLFRTLARRSSVTDAEARRRCRELVSLTARRGWRTP